MVLDLGKVRAVPDRTGIRRATDDDLWKIAGVMADAYRGTIDDEGEEQSAALEEL